MRRMMLVLILAGCRGGFLDRDDCDDGAVDPDATDLVGDDIDQDCDGVDGVDLDGDGFASDLSGGDDCDDADETVNPDASEVPYDAIDQDCDGADLTDVDGDGEDSDQVGGLDCDDDDPAIHSGAPEVPYDGIDQDCDGADLLDVDGDGFDGGDDCDDTDSGINPDASEVPYNGIDEDCDGMDLTDVDGDGIDALVAGGLDCNDADPLVFPGAQETWYDGVDSDCSGGSDYDCDGDGSDAVAFGGDDCDDNEPLVVTATVEIIGDGLDGDCQNDGDLAHMAFGGFIFDNPRPPRLAATTDHYILATATDSFDFGFQLPDVGVALAFDRTSGTDAVPIGPALYWQGATNPQPIGQAIDLVADGNVFWASTTYIHNVTNGSYLIARRAEWSALLSQYTHTTLDYAAAPLAFIGTDVDLVLDSGGQAWAVGCGADTMHALKGTGAIPAAHDTLVDVPGGVCFWQDAPDPVVNDLGEVVLCETGVDCTNYTFDPVVELLEVDVVEPWLGSTFAYADYRDGWHNVVYTSGDAWVLGLASHQVFGGHTVQSMDAVWYGPDLYAVAVVTENGAPELVLSYGDPNVSMSEVALDFGDPARPSLVLTGAAVMADADRLVVAISADDPGNTNDAVGWVFYVRP